MGKGGNSGGGGATQSTSYQTNLPEYARPYVETMLGATQKQLFQTQPGEDGSTQITGFQPYRAFGGTYDASGNMTSYDPSKAIAGFQPMQEAAQRGIAGLQVPGQFDAATQAAMAATQGALNAGNYQAGYFGNQFRAPGQYTPGQFSMAQAQAPELQQYQMSPAERVGAPGMDASLMQAAQTGYNPNLQAFQMGPAQQVGTQDYTGANVSQYMSPYMQNVVDVQQQEAKRQSDIAGTQLAGQATQAGAFGGSRYGLMEAERQRNLATQLGQIQATGSQAAFQNAQQQFNAQQQANLQAQQANQQAGLTVGGQNLAAQLGIQQLGTQTGAQMALANLTNEQQAAVQNQAAQLQASGMNAQQAMQAALANQQAGLTTGQQNLAAQLGIQQLGAGQNLQAQLANQQALQAAQTAAEQSRQYGYGQAMTAAQQRAQYGLSGQQLGEQSRQFGANLGLQGAQAGLQGASTLGALGGQQLQAQQGILGLQNQVGAQQQALEQQRINQAIQDYSNTQQYPLMQLGFMSNMLRGLPMQSVSTQQYVAQPNYLTQGIGALGAGANIYNAFKAEGGVVKSMAKGGIASVPRYDVGGEVYEDLAEMEPEQLQETIKTSSSQRIKQMAKGLLAEKNAQRMHGGGIVAFVEGTTGGRTVGDYGPQQTVEGNAGEAEAMVGMQARQAKSPEGILAPFGSAMLGSRTVPEDIKGPLTEATRIYNMTPEEHQAQMRAERAAYGVPDVSQVRADQRANLMAERANAQDEAERQRSLRLAQMFAKMATTPGPTIVAMLNAFGSQAENLITDQKEYKKFKRDLDKSIADIDESDRLEKLGFAEKGEARKQAALKDISRLNEKAWEWEQKREENLSQERRTKETASATRYSADRHFEATRLSTLASNALRTATESGIRDSRFFNAIGLAQKELGDVRSDIDKDRKNNDKLYSIINAYNSSTDNGAKPGNANPQLKSMYENAMEKLYGKGGTPDKPTGGIEGGYARRISEAEKMVNTAIGRYKTLSPNATDAFMPSDKPTAAPTGAPSEDRVNAAAARLGLGNTPAAAPAPAAEPAPAPAPAPTPAPSAASFNRMPGATPAPIASTPPAEPAPEPVKTSLGPQTFGNISPGLMQEAKAALGVAEQDYQTALQMYLGATQSGDRNAVAQYMRQMEIAKAKRDKAASNPFLPR